MCAIYTLPLRCRAGARNSRAVCTLPRGATGALVFQTRSPNRTAPVRVFPKPPLAEIVGQFTGFPEILFWITTPKCFVRVAPLSRAIRQLTSSPTALNFGGVDHSSRPVNQRIFILLFLAHLAKGGFALVFIGGRTVDSWYRRFVQAEIHSELSAVVCHVAKERLV